MERRNVLKLMGGGAALAALAACAFKIPLSPFSFPIFSSLFFLRFIFFPGSHFPLP